MLVVMEFQGLGRDMGLEGVLGIRQGRQFVFHFLSFWLRQTKSGRAARSL